MKKVFLNLLLGLSVCASAQKIRGLADTVGFAHTAFQMDEIMKRISFVPDKKAQPASVVICPHDDYTYVGNLYPEVLQHVKAKTIILIGVAHKAKNFHLENKIVFDSFQYWQGPYGKIKVSSLREEIKKSLSPNIFMVHDSMETVEHSVEAILPFLQFLNRDIEIISILVPYMNFEKMQEIAPVLSKGISSALGKRKLKWGKDVSLVISTDAVHYGDQDWGGKNFSFFGTDSSGYKQAVAFEHQIINECLNGELKPSKVEAFVNYTVQKENFKEYKWTWCGRYSVPFGLLTAYYLQQDLKLKPLKGRLKGYFNSLDHPHISVSDLHLGVTAPANLHHWVGYAGLVYE